jgi:hypothetical protein
MRVSRSRSRSSSCGGEAWCGAWWDGREVLVLVVLGSGWWRWKWLALREEALVREDAGLE